jgi:hypothetical protein
MFITKIMADEKIFMAVHWLRRKTFDETILLKALKQLQEHEIKEGARISTVSRASDSRPQVH